MQTAYEAVFILDTTQAEEQITTTVEKYSGVVTRSGGVVDDIDRLEPRRLAYVIKERREGLYFVMNFTSEPAAKDELDRIFRISDDVLRYIIVKQDKKADRFPSRARAVESERREREYAARAAANPPPAAPVEQPTVTDLGTVPHPDVAPELPNPALEVDDAPTTVTDTPDGMETTAEAAEEIRESAGSPA
ncbi:MAG: 30S ribosomal protein S6 [Cytophagales bacterium]|nr:30S ribosomal protein S6 [Armatimonadota bacterium]